VLTTTDQSTAERSSEPLKTLATYRSIDGKIMFGMNAIHDGTGRIDVGARVEILGGEV
jgi:MOSC domain-containing protein